MMPCIDSALAGRTKRPKNLPGDLEHGRLLPINSERRKWGSLRPPAPYPVCDAEVLMCQSERAVSWTDFIHATPAVLRIPRLRIDFTPEPGDGFYAALDTGADDLVITHARCSEPS